MIELVSGNGNVLELVPFSISRLEERLFVDGITMGSVNDVMAYLEDMVGSGIAVDYGSRTIIGRVIEYSIESSEDGSVVKVSVEVEVE